MTPIVRRFIKTAFGFLVLGLLTGAFMLVQRELYGIWPQAYIISAHKHAIFVGFVMFMILGVALWLFPKPLPDDRHFRPVYIETVYWLLFFGTLVRFAGELASGYVRLPWLGWLVLVAGLAQVAALLLYGWAMWNRIRPTTRRLRETQDRTTD